jgi:hypothetical protein
MMRGYFIGKLGKEEINREEKDRSIDNILCYPIPHLDNMLGSEVSPEIHTEKKWNNIFYMNQLSMDDRIQGSEGKYDSRNTPERFIFENLYMQKLRIEDKIEWARSTRNIS